MGHLVHGTANVSSWANIWRIGLRGRASPQNPKVEGEGSKTDQSYRCDEFEEEEREWIGRTKVIFMPDGNDDSVAQGSNIGCRRTIWSGRIG